LFPGKESRLVVRLTKRTFLIEHHGPNLRPDADLQQEGSTRGVN